jgi:prepilin-type N-terminal cleavage/methylation domain-containing protein/prepilin-type processing-associated H-X9-DG protein
MIAGSPDRRASRAFALGSNIPPPRFGQARRDSGSIAMDRARRGFTIVEAVVVLLILAILMALVVPALGAARESARRAQCASRQGQLARGILGYAVANNRFPPLVGRHPNPAKNYLTGSSHVNWVYATLPQLGRNDIYDSYYALDATPAQKSGKQYLSFLVCPSDPWTGSESAPLSYVVNSGRPDKPADPDNLNPLPVPSDWPANGVFTSGHIVPAHVNKVPVVFNSQDDILRGDGASFTLMLSEIVDVAASSGSSPRKRRENYIVTHEYRIAMQWDDPVSNIYGINQGVGDNKIDTAHARPSSRHPGLVVAAYCDGHVRSLHDQVAAELYARLMSSHGARCYPPGELPPPVFDGPKPSFQAELVRQSDLIR